MISKRPLAIFVVGPTASGKTKLSLEIAESCGAPIVNADSIQLYEGLKLGSSAPTEEEKARVPHELFQVIPKGDTWTVSQYESAAWKIVEGHLKKGPVVIVGGSGFYVRALEKGLSEAPPDDPEIRQLVVDRIQSEGDESVYADLVVVDPASAKKIHPNDHYRMVRALSYYLTFGRAFSEDQNLVKAREWPSPILKIGMTGTQNELRERIQQRTEKMLEDGFVAEVQGLLSEGLSEWWPMKSVGYDEVVRFLGGELSEENLRETIVQKTLALAKKQKTWFQRDKDIHWFGSKELNQALEFFRKQDRIQS